MDKSHSLIVLLGPTAVGKTELSLAIANHIDSPIISADSRQIYREIPIGTAAASEFERQMVKHYFVATHSVTEHYSAGAYENDLMLLLPQLFEQSDRLLLTGGSMMYIDAACKGIDDIPEIPSFLRNELYERFHVEGLDGILGELKILDPEYYMQVDLKNHKRVIHGLEVCLASGKPFSSFRKNKVKERPFNIVKIGLHRDRAELYDRINKRVEEMLAAGLESEARAVYHLRSNNALNTVGYKEMFRYFDGEIDLNEAKRQIQRNSRIYARKQMTWYRKDDSIHWFHPEQVEQVLDLIDEETCKA